MVSHSPFARKYCNPRAKSYAITKTCINKAFFSFSTVASSRRIDVARNAAPPIPPPPSLPGRRPHAIMAPMSPLPFVEELGRFGFALLGVLFPSLLASILARIAWREYRRTGSSRPGNGRRPLGYALAALAAAGIGLFSLSALVHQTVARIYRSQADFAMSEGRADAARSLYLDSLDWSENLEVRDQLARSLMANREVREAHAVIYDTIRRRNGKATPMENYLLGSYAFFAGNPASAVAWLEPVADHLELGWDARLLLASLYLDQNRFRDARTLFQPFLGIAATRPDHAYALARLALEDGNASEAQALLERFPENTLPEFWRGRFSALRQQLSQLPGTSR